jgi:23S rRNA (guanosine2251-2'-O)-methyltransferase
VRPKSVVEIWFREGDLHGDLEDLLNQARENHCKVRRSPLGALDKHVKSHQGVIAFAEGEPSWPSQNELKSMETGLILVLDEITDPHNVGSLMRSAWNLGAVGLISTRERSAGNTASAQKVASGAFEHVPFLEVVNLSAELKLLKDQGFWIYGLAQEGEKVICYEELAKKCVLVVGSEESGLKKPTLGVCDVVVRIPQSPGSHSFNASVAGALAGYEFLRQRTLSQTVRISTK